MSHNAGIVLVPTGEIRDIQADDRIFIQMLLIGSVVLDVQSSEQFTAVARLVIVSAKHLGRHGLAKAAATGDASILTFCIESLIDYCNQTRLVHISAIDGLAETVVALVYVRAHDLLVFIQESFESVKVQIFIENKVANARSKNDVHPFLVLILVLMEYGLGVLFFLTGRALCPVLILVLMEYGLGEYRIKDHSVSTSYALNRH